MKSLRTLGEALDRSFSTDGERLVAPDLAPARRRFGGVAVALGSDQLSSPGRNCWVNGLVGVLVCRNGDLGTAIPVED